MKEAAKPYSAGSAGSLLASSNHDSASSNSLFLIRPTLRSDSASLSAAFARHSAAV